MSYEHHQMAHLATARMLDDLRRGTGDWASANRLSPATTFWQGIADWPRPDHAFQDDSTGSSLAIEFKPPGHDKGEYVRGLGQSLTYLERFEYAAIVLPRRARDGYEIAGYLANLLRDYIGSPLPVAVLEYEQQPETLITRLGLRPRQGVAPPIPQRARRQRGVFWAYWRELSQFDLFQILVLMDKHEERFEKAFVRFWKRFWTKGKARTWEGTARQPATSQRRFRSEAINVRLSLRHTGLIDSDQRLTDHGHELLRHGKIYGPASMSFRLGLGNMILTHGRHVELIFWVEEKQRQLAAADKRNSGRFIAALDTELERSGVIAQAPTGRAKQTFLRDEQKLWNKLGLLHTSSGRSYFFTGEGFRFNWRTCIEMVNYA